MRQFLSFPFRVLPLFALLLPACSPSGGEGSADAAQAQNEQRISQADVTERQEADAAFLVKLTGNTLLEVELGKLAQARGSTPAARSYGARVVQSKLELLQALRGLATTKNLVVPAALSDDEQAAYHEVSTQAGTRLDQQVLALLVKTQDQDVEALDDMQEDAYDGDIRGLAAKYLPPVREQQAAAEEIADELDALP